MKPTTTFRTILFVVVALALLSGLVARPATAQTRIDLDVKRAVVRIVPERSTAAGPRRVEDQPGSGVIIHPSGIVLTAWHVISQDDNFSQRNYWDDFVVEVLGEDDGLPPVARYRAKIIAVRPEDDLALLRLDRKLNRQPIAPRDLESLAFLPVFTGTSDASRLLDPGNTDLRVLGYPKPFAASGEESELYIEPATLSSRSRSRGELILQETFDAGYSGGPVLVEAEGRLAVAGIILSARGSRTVLRDLAERFQGLDWEPDEQRAFAQNVRVTEVVEDSIRTIQFDMDVQSIGLDDVPIQLQINFYDANHRPWRPGTVGLLRRTDGSAYWEEDIRPDRPVVAHPVQVSFSLTDFGVITEKLTFRLVLYDKSSNRQLWSDTTWYQAQSAAVAIIAQPGSIHTPTLIRTPSVTPILQSLAVIEAAMRATLTASAPTETFTATTTRSVPTPTSTPIPVPANQIAVAVAATLTALAPSATPTATSTYTPTATLTPNAAATIQAAVRATLTAAAPTATSLSTVTLAPTRTVTPIADAASTLHFVPISLDKIVNASSQEGYVSPPVGNVQLGGVLFDIPSGQNSVTTQAEFLPSYPTRLALSNLLIRSPRQVYLLVTGGSTRVEFVGYTIGQVTLTFQKYVDLTIPIIPGENLREWKIYGTGNVISTTNANIQEVWRTPNTHDTGIGIIDMLTIDLPIQYQDDILLQIEVIDSSMQSVNSMNPAINLLGVTVFGSE
jgi:hypothetical protein